MDHGRQRYSVASTSATLYIPEENSDEEEEDDQLSTHRNNKHQRRNLNASSSSGQNGLASNKGSRRGASKGKLRHAHASHVSADSHIHTMQDEIVEEDLPLHDQMAPRPDELDGEGDTAEDPLDTMIRISSELLRTSKAILASSKRVNIVNGAIAQTAYTQEHELRRHLESLEQGNRFMSLMSRDAHYILHPTSEEPSLPSTSSYARPPQVRLRSRLSDGANPSRARTMYIHANIGSTSEAMSPLLTASLCDEPAPQQMEEQVVQEISGLFNHQQAASPSHASPKPNLASPALSSTSSSSPSTFLSSLFSRRSYASTTSSADSLPAKEAGDTAKKADAKSLLSALAGNTSTARPSKTSPERASTSQLQKQQSTASFASAAVSDTYTAQIADVSSSPSPSPSPLPLSDARPSHHRKMSSAALADAQLSAIMADNAHMTLSSRSSRGSSKGHTRSSFSLSENLLRATGGSSYTPSSPLQRKMEENERAVGKLRSVNRISGAQVPKVQISNVPIMATREGRYRELSAPM